MIDTLENSAINPKQKAPTDDVTLPLERRSSFLFLTCCRFFAYITYLPLFIAFILLLLLHASSQQQSSTTDSEIEISHLADARIKTQNRTSSYITKEILKSIHSCEEAEQLLLTLEPHAKNVLRRELQVYMPDCFRSLFDYFRNITLYRISSGRTHLNLHIPKSGGTSICHLMKKTKIRKYVEHTSNCWDADMCPWWCCCDGGKKPSCKKLETRDAEFIMNERWLDYWQGSPFCENIFYSIVLREPVNRAMSAVNNQISVQGIKDNTYFNLNKLSHTQNNYITWSLVAGHKEHPKYYYPTTDDIPEAKRVLSGFDIVIDVSMGSCANHMVHLMGSDHDIPHDGSASQSTYKTSFSYEAVKMMNLVDLELYEYAKTVMALDCDFYGRLVQIQTIHQPN